MADTYCRLARGVVNGYGPGSLAGIEEDQRAGIASERADSLFGPVASARINVVDARLGDRRVRKVGHR